MKVEDILLRLRQTEILHPYFEQAYARIYSHAVFAAPGSIIALVGPSRVGKTTLSKKLERELLGANRGAEKTAHPLIRIDAATTDQGFISMKFLTYRCLEELEHPFYDDAGYRVRLAESETKLRIQLMNALLYRKTKFLIVDEAHHLLRQKNSRVVNAALDSLKCLGNDAQIVILLLGGYELLRSCLESAHLNGRLTLVEFPNYAADVEGLAEFDQLLASVDRILPWSKNESLVAHRQYIYGGSLGCYGALIQWITAALGEMFAKRKTHLRLEHFRSTRFKEQLRPIREEISFGRRSLNPMWEEPCSDKTPVSIMSNSLAPKKTNRRAFARKPRRDGIVPIGESQ